MSSPLVEVGFAAFEAARIESGIELARSESRIARLKLAQKLELAGRRDEASTIIAEVRAEQEAEKP